MGTVQHHGWVGHLGWRTAALPPATHAHWLCAVTSHRAAARWVCVSRSKQCATAWCSDTGGCACACMYERKDWDGPAARCMQHNGGVCRTAGSMPPLLPHIWEMTGIVCRRLGTACIRWLQHACCVLHSNPRGTAEAHRHGGCVGLGCDRPVPLPKGGCSLPSPPLC
jgi:hypothetical protein